MAEFSAAERIELINAAKKSIKYALQHNMQLMNSTIVQSSEHLLQNRACFVTLQIHGRLRGCIGSLQAHQPLIQDVIHNAYSAAFKDPRFTPLTADEFAEVDIHISILSQPQPMNFKTEADLLAQIRPGIDGLILSDQGHRGTFLPSVWEQIPDKVEFLRHLKVKAGLPTNYWSNTLKVEYYTAELIS